MITILKNEFLNIEEYRKSIESIASKLLNQKCMVMLESTPDKDGTIIKYMPKYNRYSK